MIKYWYSVLLALGMMQSTLKALTYRWSDNNKDFLSTNSSSSQSSTTNSIVSKQSTFATLGGYNMIKNVGLYVLVSYIFYTALDTVCYYYNLWSQVRAIGTLPPIPAYIFYSEKEEQEINAIIQRIKNKLPLPGNNILLHSKVPGNGKTSTIPYIAQKSGAGLLVIEPHRRDYVPLQILAQKFAKNTKKPLIIFIDNIDGPLLSCNKELLCQIQQATKISGVYAAIATNNANEMAPWLTSDNQFGCELELTNPSKGAVDKMLKCILEPQLSSKEVNTIAKHAYGLSRVSIVDAIKTTATEMFLVNKKMIRQKNYQNTPNFCSLRLRQYILPALTAQSSEFANQLIACLMKKSKNSTTPSQAINPWGQKYNFPQRNIFDTIIPADNHSSDLQNSNLLRF